MNIKWISYLLLLSAISAIGIIKWHFLSKEERVVGVLVTLTLISETMALAVSYIWHNNLPIYHIFSPIEFFLISLYFNCVIPLFRKTNIGLIIGIAGFPLAILNTIFLQKITSINSNFLLFEGTAVCIYCLLALHAILLDEEHLPYRFAHFWITLCCLVFWSSTFTGWGLYSMMSVDDETVVMFFDKILTVANFVFYIGIGGTLVFRKRLIQTACA